MVGTDIILSVGFVDMEPVLSGKEAEETLQNYLIDAGRWSDEYVLNLLSSIKNGNDDAWIVQK